MESLKILASGKSPQARAQARGKLFEKLMAAVLRTLGYKIDRIPSVNYSGMEIDIEGRSVATNTPLYAECKCYETEIDSPKIQAYLGKYVTRWLINERCHGLFIAIPCLNPHAKGFYRANLEDNDKFTVRLIEEEEVLQSIYESKLVVRPEVVAGSVTENSGTAGDRLLIYTEQGFFWAQFIIPRGGGIPNRILLLDNEGSPLYERATLDYLFQLYPELDDYELIDIQAPPSITSIKPYEDAEEIVQVRGSAACFEYQFPAAPEFFVGRQGALNKLDYFVSDILSKETSARGLLYEANSGWGKSSIVLASVARLKQIGHFAIPIDSRSASSSQFILRVINYALTELGDFQGLMPEDTANNQITGFEGAVNSLLKVGTILEAHNKLLFIFLDQFENVFFLQDALKHIRNIFLKICNAQSNIVLGFSWKTDLVGLANEFPYRMRDDIAGSSNLIPLDRFSEIETNALLQRLREEIRSPLRADLTFFLSEFSQGYPWLLKKLCAHVKSQRAAGVTQSEIANSLLNVEELFQEDMRGLSADEEETLRLIAKAAPISVSELGDEFKPEIVQSLVHARLVVRIGNAKLDIYWDIFRDYLNSGRVPVQENFILRVNHASVLNASKILIEGGGKLTITEFRGLVGLAEKSFHNLIRDMRLLSLVKIDSGEIKIRGALANSAEFENVARPFIRERLSRNRLVRQLLELVESKESLTIEEVATSLSKLNPYITASNETWLFYARVFGGWMDFADLAIFNIGGKTLFSYRPGTVREPQHYNRGRRDSGNNLPYTQYTPIENVALRLYEAAQRNARVSWFGLKNSTVQKALANLEDLKFIKFERKANIITVLPPLLDFVSRPDARPHIFSEAALSMSGFSAFVNILEKNKDKRLSYLELGKELRKALGANWTDSTGVVMAKISLDWARHARLAPGVFAYKRKQRPKPGDNVPVEQESLFNSR